MSLRIKLPGKPVDSETTQVILLDININITIITHYFYQHSEPVIVRRIAKRPVDVDVDVESEDEDPDAYGLPPSPAKRARIDDDATSSSTLRQDKGRMEKNKSSLPNKKKRAVVLSDLEEEFTDPDLESDHVDDDRIGDDYREERQLEDVEDEEETFVPKRRKEKPKVEAGKDKGKSGKGRGKGKEKERETNMKDEWNLPSTAPESKAPNKHTATKVKLSKSKSKPTMQLDDDSASVDVVGDSNSVASRSPSSVPPAKEKDKPKEQAIERDDSPPPTKRRRLPQIKKNKPPGSVVSTPASAKPPALPQTAPKAGPSGVSTSTGSDDPISKLLSGAARKSTGGPFPHQQTADINLMNESVYKQLFQSVRTLLASLHKFNIERQTVWSVYSALGNKPTRER